MNLVPDGNFRGRKTGERPLLSRKILAEKFIHCPESGIIHGIVRPSN